MCLGVGFGGYKEIFVTESDMSRVLKDKAVFATETSVLSESFYEGRMSAFLSGRIKKSVYFRVGSKG